LKSLETSCEQLGVQTRHSEDGYKPETDVCLILEQDLSTYAQRKQIEVSSTTGSVLDKPLVIVCKSAISMRQLRASSVGDGFTTRRVKYVAQPIGPEVLGKAIKHCLQDTSSVVVDEGHAAQGAASDIDVEPDIRHNEMKDSHQTGFQLPLRLRPNGLRYDVPANPPTPDEEAPKPGINRTSTDKLPTPPEDYLSERSKPADPPARPQVMEIIPAPKPSVRVDTQSAPSSGMSLLLVDDNVSQATLCPPRTY